jgi:hypothetical protein
MIGFLNPLWLWALPLAAVPLILHLVARRQPPTVPFPAVRYLQQVTRDHRRRLKLQHWLLLLVRTLLMLALLLAAAGPTLARDGLVGHAPAAMVLVLDNSPSSGAVTDGTPMLDRLRQAAGAVLDKATAEDALWLVTADGLARRAPVEVLRATIDTLTPSEVRLDLGEAIAQARDILATESRPAEVVVLSDLQQSALSGAAIDMPVVVGVPTVVPPPNLGIASLDPGPQPWSPGDHRVRVRLFGDSGRASPMAVRLDNRADRPRLATVGPVIEAVLTAGLPGWWPVVAELDPDEFRADDHRSALVRVLPVARAQWNPANAYLATAAMTLVEGGRLRHGTEVTLGWLGPGGSVVEPPADLAELGSVNRALERRGVPWRYDGPVVREQMSDSGALLPAITVTRRLRLSYAGGAARGIEATVGGAPWIVRAGGVVVLGSRLDPTWTGLPTSAAFVPFIDALANRLVRGEQALVNGTPGAPVQLPDDVDDVVREGRTWRVEGGAAWRPPATGVYLLRSGADTLGALAVNLDPRESALAPASRSQVEALWSGARLVSLPRVGDAAFGAGARGHLRAPLLWLALLLGLVEMGLASVQRRTT